MVHFRFPRLALMILMRRHRGQASLTKGKDHYVLGALGEERCARGQVPRWSSWCSWPRRSRSDQSNTSGRSIGRARRRGTRRRVRTRSTPASRCLGLQRREVGQAPGSMRVPFHQVGHRHRGCRRTSRARWRSTSTTRSRLIVRHAGHIERACVLRECGTTSCRRGALGPDGTCNTASSHGAEQRTPAARDAASTPTRHRHAQGVSTSTTRPRLTPPQLTDSVTGSGRTYRACSCLTSRASLAHLHFANANGFSCVDSFAQGGRRRRLERRRRSTRSRSATAGGFGGRVVPHQQRRCAARSATPTHTCERERRATTTASDTPRDPTTLGDDLARLFGGGTDRVRRTSATRRS